MLGLDVAKRTWRGCPGTCALLVPHILSPSVLRDLTTNPLIGLKLLSFFSTCSFFSFLASSRYQTSSLPSPQSCLGAPRDGRSYCSMLSKVALHQAGIGIAWGNASFFTPCSNLINQYTSLIFVHLTFKSSTLPTRS